MKDHAAIVLKNYSDPSEVLFLQRSATKKSLPNKWAFPSGTVEEREAPEETAVREAQEELDVEVKAEGILTQVELPELSTRLLFILCAMLSEKPLTYDKSEIQAIKWRRFEAFFKEHTDEEIGHGLIFLRSHPETWKEIYSKS